MNTKNKGPAEVQTRRAIQSLKGKIDAQIDQQKNITEQTKNSNRVQWTGSVPSASVCCARELSR